MLKPHIKVFVYIAGVAISFLVFTTGITTTWSSPLLERFGSNDSTVNPLQRPLTATETGLMVSIINLGVLFGPFITGAVVERIGKKMTILLSQLPLCLAHLMCTIYGSYELIIAARILMGVSKGMAWSVCSGYLSEISEPENRGFINSLVAIMAAVGSLFSYVVGPFVSVRTFSIINLAPSAIFIVSVYFFIPGSPYDLAMTNQTDAARQSLQKLRQTDNVEDELKQIYKLIECSSEKHSKLTDIFRDKASSRALAIACALMTFNGFSGILVIFGYTQTIFALAGSAIRPEYSSMIVGTVASMSTVLSLQLIDRLGRKPLMMISVIISCLAHGSLGIFFFLQARNYDLTSVSWLPICSMIIFMFAHHLGLSSLPWIISGEIFAPRVKATAMTMCNIINFLIGFVLTLVYPIMIESIGISNSFFLFSASLALCAVYTFLRLPETKGRTFDEIFALLHGDKDKGNVDQ